MTLRLPFIPRIMSLFSSSGSIQELLEIEEELASHVQMRKLELIAEGWSERDAEEEARRRFGDFFAVRNQCIEERGVFKNYRFWIGITFASALAIAVLIYSYYQSNQSGQVATEKIEDLIRQLSTASELQESDRHELASQAIDLIEKTKLTGLRIELIRKLATIPDESVQLYINRILLEGDSRPERIAAIEGLALTPESVERNQNRLMQVAIYDLDQQVAQASLQKLVNSCSDTRWSSIFANRDATAHARLFAYEELHRRFAGKPTYNSILTQADTVATIEELIVSAAIDESQKIRIITLARRTKHPNVKQMLINATTTTSSQSNAFSGEVTQHLIHSFGLYIEDPAVQQIVNSFVDDPRLPVRNSARRALGLLTN